MNQRIIDGPEGRIAIYENEALDETALPIVFLHCDAGRASQWDAVWNLLGDKHRLVSLDFRGHGASAPAENRNYGYPGRADDVAAAVKAAGLTHFMLVAHSAGGGVALEFAMRRSDLVAAVLLVDPASDPRKLPEEQRKGMIAAIGGRDGPKVLKDYLADMAGSNIKIRDRVRRDSEAVAPDARRGVIEALGDWNPEPTLKSVRAPIQMIVTDRGEGPGALFHLRPDIPHHVIHGTGHWVQLERPTEIAMSIETFTKSVQRIAPEASAKTIVGTGFQTPSTGLDSSQ